MITLQVLKQLKFIGEIIPEPRAAQHPMADASTHHNNLSLIPYNICFGHGF